VPTIYRTKTKTKQKNGTQENKKMSNTDPVKIPGLNPGVHEGYAVHVSYKTLPCSSYCQVR